MEMREMERIRRDVRLLKVCAVVMTALCGIVLLTDSVRPDTRDSFTEIDVERISIIEADETLRMAISNQGCQHPGTVNGTVIPRRGPRPPGLIFFNQLGEEMGALVFGANGDVVHRGGLTWDKVSGDQTIGFRYLEGDNGTYSSAPEMWQQPNIPSDVITARYGSATAIADSIA